MSCRPARSSAQMANIRTSRCPAVVSVYPRWVLDGQTTKFPKLDFLRDSTVQSAAGNHGPMRCVEKIRERRETDGFSPGSLRAGGWGDGSRPPGRDTVRAGEETRPGCVIQDYDRPTSASTKRRFSFPGLRFSWIGARAFYYPIEFGTNIFIVQMRVPRTTAASVAIELADFSLEML
jgi:hypothetical protein